MASAADTTPGARARTSSSARVAALLLPLLVLAAGFFMLQRPDRPTGKAFAFERKLKVYNTDVLVLGSSLARTNVRTDLLADELGVPRRNVVMLTLPNATAAHWYAIMRNRVFENGHKPRVVILVGALTTMVTPEILMDSNVERLMNQLSDDEPVIGAKVLGTTSPARFRYLFMRERAGAIRDDLLVSYRDWALTTLLSSRGKIAEGRRLAEQANEVVFADDRMDYTLHNRSSTGLFGGGVEELDLTGLDIEADSLIPDIGELATSFGSNVVFVRTPFPPSNADNDLVAPELETEAAEAMAAAGAGYLDLRSLNLDDSYFQDMRHMSREGATLFTQALAASLTDMGVLERSGAVSVDVGLAPTRVTRQGNPPDLDGALASAARVSGCEWKVETGAVGALTDVALRRAGHPGASPLRITHQGEAVPWRDLPPDDCRWGARMDEDGLRMSVPQGAKREDIAMVLDPALPMPVEGEDLPRWWVYPGTALEFTFDKPWAHDADLFEVFLLGHVFGGAGGTPVIQVGDASSPTEILGQRAWVSASMPPPTTGAWSLRVEVPEDGPWLLVQNLAVGAMPRTSHLIGLPESLNGASIRLVGGKVEDTQLAPIYRSAPPKMPQPKVRRAPREVAMVAYPNFSALADAPHARATRPHKCSPVRIDEDGVELAVHHEVCLNMANLKGGRSCHAGNMLYFAASDGSNPVENDRKYSFRLDESRICDRRNQRDTTPLRGVLWLYPGDHLVLPFPADRLATFYDGANKLEIEVEAPIHQTGEALDVRLFVGDEEVLQETVTAPVVRRREESFIFEPALPARAQDIRLEVKNPSSGAYWLLLKATLSEEYDYGFGLEEEEEPAASDTDVLPIEEGLDTDDMFGPSEVDPFSTDEDDQGGAQDLEDWTGPARLELPTAVTRIGEVPAIPALRDVGEARSDLVEGKLFALWPVSNTVLEKRGKGWWSPVEVLEGDDLLRPAVGRRQFRMDCQGCFLHFGQSIIARPRDTDEELSVRLSSKLPLDTVSGHRVYWTYPGNGLKVSVEEPWRGESVQLRAAMSAFTTEKNTDWPPPTMLVHGQRVTFVAVGEKWEARLTLSTATTGPWDVEIETPRGGPYWLLEEVQLRDERGLVTLIETPEAAKARAELGPKVPSDE